MEDEGDASFDLSQISGRRRQVRNDRRRSSHNLRVYIPALSSLSLVLYVGTQSQWECSFRPARNRVPKRQEAAGPSG